MENCMFCKIASGEAESKKILESSNFIVFEDIHPSAPIHYLIVPKKHVRDMTELDMTTWDEVREVAMTVAKEKNLTGYRIATNVGDAAMVPHFHVHLLSGIKKDRKV
ncbi:HIT domain-containing protein [Candidatus Microgenomates bacterium]|nr:MAG: HIT domain-containing protein [Candidatus Microgenomates bacterium]